MFQILELFFAGVQLLSNITLIPEYSVDYPKKRDSVVTLAAHREWWRDDGKGKCRFTGVMVPFVRDWEETVVNGGDTKVIPALPDTTAGHAILINKKLCQGQEPQEIFRVGGTSAANLFMRLSDGGSFQSYDFYEMTSENIPPWLPQVLDRIERVAATDSNARMFVLESEKHFEAVRSKK